MELNINDAILNNDVVSAIKNIQECKNTYPEIIEKQMNLLISQRANIQETDAQIMERLEDLNLLKGFIKAICNANHEFKKERSNI